MSEFETMIKKQAELEKYKRAFNILMDYWDSFQKDQQEEINKKLTELGL